MLINMNRPQVVDVHTLDKGSAGEFHVIDLRGSSSGGGLAILSIRGDWSDWDAMVAAVNEYRSKAAAGTEALAG